MTEYEAYDTVISLAFQTYRLMFGYFSLIFAFLVMRYMPPEALHAGYGSIVFGSPVPEQPPTGSLCTNRTEIECVQ